MSSSIIAPPIDLSVQTLVPDVDVGEAQALAEKIDVQSPLSVAQFGREIAQEAAGYTDTLLQQARGEDLAELGGKLGEIMVAAQSFDLSSFDNQWTRLPLVGALLRQVSLTKEKALARFRSVEGQVSRLMSDVDGALERLAARAETFDGMYQSVVRENKLLATHVKAGEIRLRDLEAEIVAFQGQPATLENSEAHNKLEASRNALSKRIGDLAALQHSAVQTLPMIRMMQANNVVLLEKFQTIRTLTIPAWKRAFIMALALNEQRDAVALADNIDDATNYFLKRNSEILHENAVATARASQRQVIDVETLRQVHENVLNTLADVQSAYSDGAAKRKSAMAELAKMRASMIEGFTSKAIG